MKKIFFIIGIVLILIILVINIAKERNVTSGAIEMFKEYERKATDVYARYGEVERMDIFEEFMNKVENEEEAYVRIASDIWAAPTVWDIHYKNGKFKAKSDYTYDPAGPYEIEHYTCDEIIKKELIEDSKNKTVYVFKSCKNQEEDIYIFEKSEPILENK